MLDRIDKAILRLLLKYKEQTLTINQVAKKVEVSPRTVKKHIEKLKEEGYVFTREEGKVRKFKKNGKKNN